MTRAYIGLGSNVGDRLAHLQAAVSALRATDGVVVDATSSVYETEPVGPPQRDFLNAVVAVDSSLAARDLLDACKRIEIEAGRRLGERWGPREIDLDLLVFGEEVIDEDAFTLPHRGIATRAFVLVPLLEIAPAITVPGAGVAADLLRDIGDGGVVRTGDRL